MTIERVLVLEREGAPGESLEQLLVTEGFQVLRARDVAQAARSAGYRLLFNSEPVTRVHEIDGCLVAGRFSVQRGNASATAAALATRQWLPRSRQWAYWNSNKVLKKLGGAAWLTLRKRILNR